MRCRIDKFGMHRQYGGGGGTFKTEGGPSSHSARVLARMLDTVGSSIVSEEECSARLVN